jgi:hypothetical protein
VSEALVRWGEAFDAMRVEWASIARRGRPEVVGWQRKIACLVGEEQVLRAEGRWLHGRSDYLGILGQERSELGHSAMIAWLLDPCGRHGLGSRLLERVVRLVHGGRLPLRPEALATARSRCEVAVGEGRLDIVVDAPGVLLVIENKVDVDGREAPGQCDAHFDELCGSDARFVLLSPDGRAAASDREDVRSAFRPLTYRALARLLREALLHSSKRADARRVAEDYLRTLDKEFS